VGWHGSLGQCFAVGADPFATDVLLNAELTRCVIEFLADIFTDALELTTIPALRVFWLVYDFNAWQLCRDGDTFGLLFGFIGDGFILNKIGPLQLDGTGISLNNVVQQTAL